MKEHLKQLMDGGIIRKSKSPWSSNVVLCRKKKQRTQNVRRFQTTQLKDEKGLLCITEDRGYLKRIIRKQVFYHLRHEKWIPSNRTSGTT